MLDLAELYRQHRAYVRGCLQSCRVPEAALDDAIQDVFLVLFRRLEDYDASRGSLRAWLFGISLRVARRHRRTHGRAIEPPAQLAADDAVADPESYTSRLQAADLADRILDRLPRDQLSVLVLSDIEQLSGPEIARTLQLEQGTVYSRLSRARKRLRKEVQVHRRELGLEATPWLAGLIVDFRRWLRPARPGLQAAAFVSVRTMRALLVIAGVAATAIMMLSLRSDAEPEPEPAADAGAGADAPTALAPDRWRRGLEGSDQQLLQQRSTTIEGTVSREGGAPLADAEVCAWLESDILSAEHRVPPCTRTDPAGHYQLGRLLASRYRVTATAAQLQPGQHDPGRGRTTITLRRGERRAGIDITLAPGGVPLQGHVADVIGGSVEHARVMIRGARHGTSMEDGQWGAWPPVLAHTDAEGRFSAWVREGDLQVLAAAEGYAQARTRAVAPGLTVELVLSPESTIGGQVVDRASGQPVARAKIVVDRGQDTAEDPHVTYADDHGRFRLAGLLPGRYKPRATAPGRLGDAGVSFDLGLGESRDEVVIEMITAPTVTGTIVVGDEAAPCPAGAVGLQSSDQSWPEFAMADAAGRVVFEAVMPGTYDVFIACQGHASPTDVAPLVVADADLLDQRWPVAAGRSITGRVVDAAGAPVSEAFLMAYAAGPAASRMPMSARTGPDGAFALRGAAPGAYSLQASHDVRGQASPVEVTVVEGEDPAPLELVLAAAGTIEGRVLDQRGTPQPGVAVSLVEGRYATTTTDDDGRFRFRGLAPARYAAVVRHHAAELARASVVLGAEATEQIELTLPTRDGQITGTLRDEDGAPVRDAIVTSLPDAVGQGRRSLAALRAAADFGRGRAPVLTDEDGAFRLAVPADQTYTVLAQRRGGGDAIASGVAEGSVVRLEIPARGTLAGTVTTNDGQVPDALVVTARNVDTGEVRQESFFFDGGGFRFEQLGAGHYELVAVATQGRLRHTLELRAGEDAEDLRLSLVGGVTVRGRVVDLHSGQPVPGMMVVAGADDTDINEFAKKMQSAFTFTPEGHLTDDQGRFELHEVPPGAIRLSVMSQKIGEDAYGSALFATAKTGFDPEVELPALTIATMPGGKGVQHRAPGFGFDGDLYPWCHDTTVASIEPGSPAERAGIVVGDIITAVGGHDVTGGRCYLALRLGQLPPAGRVAVTLARGETVTLIAAAAPGEGS